MIVATAENTEIREEHIIGFDCTITHHERVNVVKAYIECEKIAELEVEDGNNTKRNDNSASLG